MTALRKKVKREDVSFKSLNFMKIIFLGAPGSGKGTQSKKIAEKFSISHLSTGDILRDSIKQKTAVGIQAKQFMDEGHLVPDDLIVNIIKERISAEDCSKGYILDGFPRTVAQADALKRMFDKQTQHLNKVIYLEIENEKVIERLTGRRVCSECGAEYHIYFKQPVKSGICDLCQNKLIQRSDDNEEKIRNRLLQYDQQTSPLIKYYEEQKLLKRIPAEGEIQEITKKIIDTLSL